MHSLNSETSTTEADWPITVHPIQSIMKNSPSRQLGGRTPVAFYTGMPSGNSLVVALSGSKIRSVRYVDQVRLQQKMNADSLLALDRMHKDVDATFSTSCK